MIDVIMDRDRHGELNLEKKENQKVLIHSLVLDARRGGKERRYK